MQAFILRCVMLFSVIMAVLLITLFLSGCGQPLAGIDVPQRSATKAPIAASTSYAPTQDYTTSEVAAPRATLPPLQPRTQLPAYALGTFDTNQISSLEVGGRYYWKQRCGRTHCEIKLWPDNTVLWVTKETIGEAATSIVVTPQQLDVPVIVDTPVITTVPAANEPVFTPLPASESWAEIYAHNTAVAITRTADAANMYATATAQVRKP